MLKTIRFLGQVLPVEVDFTLPGELYFSWVWQERNMTIGIKISIHHSRIVADCTVADFQPSDTTELYRRAYDNCRALISLNSFRTGVARTFILDRWIRPDDGIESILLMMDNRLPPLCTSIHSDADFNTIFRAIVESHSLMRLLGDLIDAISIPHEGPASCARAVEGLKWLIASDRSDSAAWESMRSALNLDRAYLIFITKHSTDIRHGKAPRIEGPICMEIILRSWIIMNRFFEYLKRGKTPLPVAEFPLLRG
ncbi:MAG TPA: hypothetical protein VHT03_12265 [Rhizomicrobium sp.]|jgi:hypothetical protein|nr:hypothetical protein [Rhizomicrobium sp.]